MVSANALAKSCNLMLQDDRSEVKPCTARSSKSSTWSELFGEAAFRSRTGRGSEPIAVPIPQPRATVAISERRVIVGIRRRRRTNDDGAGPVVERTRFCGRCPSVRASGRTRYALIRWRGNDISWSGAWCCRRDGYVTRLRHRIGTGRIENERRRRRRRRYILRLRACDQDAGTKHDCASAQRKLRQCYLLKSPRGHYGLL